MRKIRPSLTRQLLLLSTVLLSVGWAAAAGAACSALTVNHAWVRAAPPGAPVMAGYMTLTNGGDSAVKLVAVSSPQFKGVQMHQSMVGANGMASMRPVEAVTIAAGSTFEFAPGDYHLMMFSPLQPLATGDKVALKLHCADDQAVSATAVVRSVLPGAGMASHGDPMQQGG